MNSRRLFASVFVVALASLILAIACGGAGGRPVQPGGTPTGGGSTGAGAAAPEILYAATSTGIGALVVDQSAGTLTGVPNQPFLGGGQPAWLALDPSGNFLYSVNAVAGSSNVFTFSINTTTGVLTTTNRSTFPGTPGFITVDPSGANAYVASSSGANERRLGAFSIDPGTHALTMLPNFPITTAVLPQSIAMDPQGRFVYVLGPGTVDVFARDGANGAVTEVPGSPFSFATFGGTSSGIAVTPSGAFVLATLSNSNSVAVLAVDASGALTPVSGSPFASGQGASGVAVDPSGRFVYVANQGLPPNQGSVSSFSIDANGALTSLGPQVAAGVQPDAVTVEPAGHFVFVGNLGSTFISVYSLDQTTGTLTPVNGNPSLVSGGVRVLAVLPPH